MADIPDKGFYARFLGGFSLEYEGRDITITKNLNQKALQLLVILLKAGSKGVDRKRLVEMLESDIEGWEKKLSNLRNQASRLRKMIRESDFPEGEYIEVHAGRYYFRRDCPVTTDTGRIDELAQRIRDGTEGEERIELLEQICRLYQGEFLPALMAEEWAVIEGAGYQSLYFQCLEELSGVLKERGEYTELFELCSKASEWYPYDEWQSVQIDCLMAKNRCRDAWKLYTKATEVFSRELGMAPFEKQMEYYRKREEQRSDRENRLIPEGFGEIKNQLSEEQNQAEAYQCSYPSFIDASRVFMRIAERSHMPLLLMLCTVKRGTEQRNNEIRQKGSGPGEWEETLERQMEKFRQFLAVSIRDHDIYTQYSKNQFLVLLVDISEEQGQVVAERLRNVFSEISESSVLEVEMESLEEPAVEEAV